MELTADQNRLIEKMFDAALKEKVNQLARKYDPGLVFRLWTRLAKANCIKPYFCRWRWRPDMTISEAMDCLDDYFTGLEALLRKHQAAKEGSSLNIKNQKLYPEGEQKQFSGRGD